MILRDALAFGIHQRQIVLSTGVTLFGSHAIPLQRVGVAVSNTATFIVHAPQSVLRLSVALIGKLEQEGQCRRVVALVIRRNGVLQRSSQHGCCKAQRQQEQGGSVTKHGLHGSGHRFIQTFAARRRRQLGWECVAGRFLWVQLQLRPAGLRGEVMLYCHALAPLQSAIRSRRYRRNRLLHFRHWHFFRPHVRSDLSPKYTPKRAVKNRWAAGKTAQRRLKSR
jgi:hypothetical protein